MYVKLPEELTRKCRARVAEEKVPIHRFYLIRSHLEYPAVRDVVWGWGGRGVVQVFDADVESVVLVLITEVGFRPGYSLGERANGIRDFWTGVIEALRECCADNVFLRLREIPESGYRAFPGG